MSPRIAYWTSSFEFESEAVASEVALLRRAFPQSVAWGVSKRDRFRCSLSRGFCVSPRLERPFRIVTGVLQSAFQLNHLFGGLGDWSHFRALNPKKPAVLTLAVSSPCAEPMLLKKVSRFVVEWPAAKTVLSSLGIESDRIDLIHPPVDLQRFSANPRPDGPFTVLFLSSPDRSDWLEARGVDLLLDAAEMRPATRLVLLWRPWGDSAATVRAEIARRRLSNVQLEVGRIRDVERRYGDAHVTAAPFRDLDRCKPSPNSIIESLACGRPVLVTRTVGLSDLIEQNGAGVVTESSPKSIAVGLDRLEAEWIQFSENARRLAELQFSAEKFIAAYRNVYSKLL